jgi:hypothetical protein
MMLDHYQQTKNLLVSYDINKLGFFYPLIAMRSSVGGGLPPMRECQLKQL